MEIASALALTAALYFGITHLENTQQQNEVSKIAIGKPTTPVDSNSFSELEITPTESQTPLLKNDEKSQSHDAENSSFTARSWAEPFEEGFLLSPKDAKTAEANNQASAQTKTPSNKKIKNTEKEEKSIVDLSIKPAKEVLNQTNISESEPNQKAPSVDNSNNSNNQESNLLIKRSERLIERSQRHQSLRKKFLDVRQIKSNP